MISPFLLRPEFISADQRKRGFIDALRLMLSGVILWLSQLLYAHMVLMWYSSWAQAARSVNMIRVLG